MFRFRFEIATRTKYVHFGAFALGILNKEAIRTRDPRWVKEIVYKQTFAARINALVLGFHSTGKIMFQVPRSLTKLRDKVPAGPIRTRLPLV